MNMPPDRPEQDGDPTTLSCLEGLGLRIAQAAETLGGKRNLARRSGVHETQLYKYIRGGSAPSLSVCLAIARAAGVSLDWLVSGSEGPASTQAIKRYPALMCPVGQPWPGTLEAMEPLAFDPVELHPRGLDATDLLAVQLPPGQSCAPLAGGGTVLIERHAAGLQGDGLYLLALGGVVRVQRVQCQLDGSLTLLAIGPEWRDLHLPAERSAELGLIGRVLWICSWQG